jgi:peptidoglycan/LPS O-acetylase OafA/YrhL
MLVLTIPMMLGPLAGDAHWSVPAAVAASLGYVGNWAQAWDVGALGPLRHTWSLSIEEQFYLLWPAVFVALSRRGRSLTRWLGTGIVLVVLARLAGWELTYGVWPYFATFTHSDGLLAGALLAVLLERGAERGAGRGFGERDRRFSGALSAAAVVTLVGLFATLDVPMGATYVGGLTLSAAATVVLVRHLAIVPGGLLARALQWRPLVGAGRISYGLYLYHVPIFTLVRTWHLGFVSALSLEVGASFAVALVSWFVVERPAQRWAHDPARIPVRRVVLARAVPDGVRPAVPAPGGPTSSLA